VDPTGLDTFAHGFPHVIFPHHRERAPVWWPEPSAHTPDSEGFCSVATCDEVFQGVPSRQEADATAHHVQ
jgi:hypothetical protein